MILRLLPALLAVLALAATPAAAQVERPPEITVLHDGLQSLKFIPQSAKAAGESYPFLKPLIGTVSGMDKLGAKDRSGASTFRTAMVKDRDLKANLVFLSVQGPFNCVPEGCAFFAFVNTGKGFKTYTPLYARDPVKIAKTGKSIALVFRTPSGRVKWPHRPDGTFSYEGLYLPKNETPPSPLREKAAPMSVPPGG